mgnify:CR=1 FL=1
MHFFQRQKLLTGFLTVDIHSLHIVLEIGPDSGVYDDKYRITVRCTGGASGENLTKNI